MDFLRLTPSCPVGPAMLRTHLRQGVLGLGAYGLAYILPSHLAPQWGPAVTLALLGFGLWQVRGCPICWSMRYARMLSLWRAAKQTGAVKAEA